MSYAQPAPELEWTLTKTPEYLGGVRAGLRIAAAMADAEAKAIRDANPKRGGGTKMPDANHAQMFDTFGAKLMARRELVDPPAGTDTGSPT